MRRLTFRIVVTVLTFTIGVTSTSLWFLFSRPSTMKPQAEVSAPSQAPAKQERTYSRGPAGMSTKGSFITLNSSDGMSFKKWTVDYESPERANREFRKRLKKAIEIMSREPVFSDNIRSTGEKVVARFPDSYEDAGPASLLWTDGAEFVQVDSSSVQNILEYRKDFGR